MKEIKRFKVLTLVEEGRMTWVEAASKFKLSMQHIYKGQSQGTMRMAIRKMITVRIEPTLTKSKKR